ncbi:hypothetical protein NDU88_012639 [Pleurodeles waltl]|uniref:Uncharacterized protein n=1 Tax=Pleurodeles waltl TaxID=8319 RepID=A0AAV7R3C6_PLEWA|nr:hypothetical protein NDU88_012639 [Pleurodeles waltl]
MWWAGLRWSAPGLAQLVAPRGRVARRCPGPRGSGAESSLAKREEKPTRASGRTAGFGGLELSFKED